MSTQTQVQTKWTLASVALTDAYTDFILSRQAMNCTEATMEFYKFTAGKFLRWLEEQGVTRPEEVSARYVRQFFAELMMAGKSDTTVRDNARAIRTLLNFWYEEKYLPSPIKFEMPKVARKKLPVLSADELQKVIKACDNARDKALTLFLADSGLRREEMVKLNWRDVDMKTGLVFVARGKGGKMRSSVVGATTRRALLKYRRELQDTSEDAPLFQSRTRERLTGDGVRLIFRRLSIKTGIKVTPHALRRTFTILSLRAEMDVLTLQNLLGHADLTMVQHYAQMMDEDLVREHSKHSPIDRLK